MSNNDRKFWNAYFDDIEGHIEMLKDEAAILDDCEKRDELEERIEYLQIQLLEGKIWIDNDVSASPDKWKTLKTFSDAEAEVQYKVWEQE